MEVKVIRDGTHQESLVDPAPRGYTEALKFLIATPTAKMETASRKHMASEKKVGAVSVKLITSEKIVGAATEETITSAK